MSSRFPDEIEPFIDPIERGFEADIDDYEAGICVADVAGDQRPEALLPRGVPELQSESFPLNLHGLGDEVDAHCRLHTPSVTLAVN